MIRVSLFLISVVLCVLGLISLFTRFNQDIDRAKILESLALAFGLAGAFSEMRNPPKGA